MGTLSWVWRSVSAHIGWYLSSQVMPTLDTVIFFQQDPWVSGPAKQLFQEGVWNLFRRQRNPQTPRNWVSIWLIESKLMERGSWRRNPSIECVRSCDQKPYLHNETKGVICIKIQFNPQKNISLLQDGRRFFVYSSNMAAVTSCEHTLKGFIDILFTFLAFLLTWFKRK